uniref:Putative secreted protein n=1 Tax=Anopheles darlingi TaxID=43151 RepID=A0A2M4DDH4_ANODA
MIFAGVMIIIPSFSLLLSIGFISTRMTFVGVSVLFSNPSVILLPRLGGRRFVRLAWFLRALSSNTRISLGALSLAS